MSNPENYFHLSHSLNFKLSDKIVLENIFLKGNRGLNLIDLNFGVSFDQFSNSSRSQFSNLNECANAVTQNIAFSIDNHRSWTY